MTREEAIEYGLRWKNAIIDRGDTEGSDAIQFLNMAIEALEQENIKFYYVESLDDYWVGRRLDNFYYATWHERFGFIWSHSKYLPWGEHIVDENTWWKEHTYPSEPKEIPFPEWIVGFTKKYFQQEQIIHCKDCKYAKPFLNRYHCKQLDEDWEINFGAEHYCSFAERKEQ